MNRTDRLYAIVEELRAVTPTSRSAPWLAERFEVSVRTIERDLSALQQTGVPIYATPGRRGGYTLDAVHTLPPVNLTPVEVTAVAVALSNPGATPFAAAGRSALLKLMAVMAEDDAAGARALAARVQFYDDPEPEPVVGAETAETMSLAARGRGGARLVLEQAIVERRVTRLSYIDRRDQPTERVVEPVAVVGRVPNWYLVAWCQLRNDLRSFRLDRVQAATLEDEIAPHRDGVEERRPHGFVIRTPTFD